MTLPFSYTILSCIKQGRVSRMKRGNIVIVVVVFNDLFRFFSLQRCVLPLSMIPLLTAF